MTENKRFQIIHLGNPYDFVVKDHNTNKTYGTLQGDDKSLMELLNELSEEKEQLKQRNDRQAKRLAELYELMAKKDWESLTDIIDDFCSCEEQLQRESGTYGDFE